MAVVRFAFYVFVVAMVFEKPYELEAGAVTTARLAAYLFAASTLLYPKRYLRRPPLACWLFLGYLLVHAAIAILLRPTIGELSFGDLRTCCQGVILLWLASNVVEDNHMVGTTLLVVGVSCSLLALLAFFGIGVTESEWKGTARINILGFDENYNGFLYDLGILSLLGVMYEVARNSWWMRFALWPPVIVMMVQLARTGSRGAMVSLVCGITAFVLSMRGTGGKFKAVLLASCCVGGLAVSIYHTDVAKERWATTATAGDMSGRKEITLEAIGMFLEKPILGWGPTEHLAELAGRLHYEDGPYRDTHNDILWALTATGLAGGIFFIGAMFCCARAAWRGRGDVYGIAVCALVVAVFVTGLSITVHHRKAFWLVLALAIASGRTVSRLTRHHRRTVAP